MLFLSGTPRFPSTVDLSDLLPLPPLVPSQLQVVLGLGGMTRGVPFPTLLREQGGKCFLPPQKPFKVLPGGSLLYFPSPMAPRGQGRKKWWPFVRKDEWAIHQFPLGSLLPSFLWLPHPEIISPQSADVRDPWSSLPMPVL